MADYAGTAGNAAGDYVPGVCNIGKSETGKRYALAAAGFVIAAGYVLAAGPLGLSHLALVLAFIPLVIAFEGLYQGYFHFCAGFAARRMFDLSGSGGGMGKVADEDAHNQDMEKAKQIHAYSIVSAIVATAIIYAAMA